MGADCKSVAKATKVRILDPPHGEQTAPVPAKRPYGGRPHLSHRVPPGTGRSHRSRRIRVGGYLRRFLSSGGPLQSVHAEPVRPRTHCWRLVDKRRRSSHTALASPERASQVGGQRWPSSSMLCPISRTDRRPSSRASPKPLRGARSEERRV